MSNPTSFTHWDEQTITKAARPLFEGKNILLGLTGGIAVYKSIELCRLLIKAGAQVRVVMTSGALAFIQPLAFQAVTGQEPHIDLLDASAEAGMGHIELARWADALVITPCSANTLANLAQGSAQDLLSTLALATTAPVAIAPAMNQQMWRHPATQRNLAQVEKDGLIVFHPASGLQACGDEGPGRAQEPSTLFSMIETLFAQSNLQGQKVLITAGPTREAIDPVRFISNHSSGKMGYALARAAMLAGAEVTLISGPSHCTWPINIQGQKVESAQDMLTACDGQFHIIIGAAAVGDFKPQRSANHKLGKKELQNQLQLSENPDIIRQLALNNQKATVVGFAAQTHDLQSLAHQKLDRKGLNLICANDVSDKSIGFNAVENTVTLLSKTRPPLTLGPLPKELLAQAIIAAIGQM